MIIIIIVVVVVVVVVIIIIIIIIIMIIILKMASEKWLADGDRTEINRDRARPYTTGL